MNSFGDYETETHPGLQFYDRVKTAIPETGRRTVKPQAPKMVYHPPTVEDEQDEQVGIKGQGTSSLSETDKLFPESSKGSETGSRGSITPEMNQKLEMKSSQVKKSAFFNDDPNLPHSLTTLRLETFNILNSRGQGPESRWPRYVQPKRNSLQDGLARIKERARFNTGDTWTWEWDRSEQESEDYNTSDSKSDSANGSTCLNTIGKLSPDPKRERERNIERDRQIHEWIRYVPIQPTYTVGYEGEVIDQINLATSPKKITLSTIGIVINLMVETLVDPPGRC